MLKQKVKRFLDFSKDISLSGMKTQWNDLAKKNAKYFIYSNLGEDISEDDFRRSGEEDVKEHILDDSMFDIQNQVVVEIGCGNGRMTEFIAQHAKFVYAFDISEEMIAQAKERLKHLKNVHFEATDGATIPVSKASVDRVFSFIVFQHMPDRRLIRKNLQEIDVH